MNRNKKNANEDFRNLERSIQQNIKTAIKNADYGQIRKFTEDGDKLFEKHLNVNQETNTRGGYGIETAEIDIKCISSTARGLKSLAIQNVVGEKRFRFGWERVAEKLVEHHETHFNKNDEEVTIEHVNKKTWQWAANRFVIFKNISPHFGGFNTGFSRFVNIYKGGKKEKPVKAKVEKSRARVNENAKLRAQRRAEQEAEEEAEANEDYDQDNGQVSNTVLEHVRECIIKALKNSESDKIDYMKAVIEPECFATTVENMFHVSFLVKKKELAISEDRNGYIWLVNVGMREAQMNKRIRMDNNDRKDQVQTIFNIDMKGWKDLSEGFVNQDSNYKPFIVAL